MISVAGSDSDHAAVCPREILLAGKSTRKKSRRRCECAGPPAGLAARVAACLRDSGAGRWLLSPVLLWLLLAVLYPGPMFQGEVFAAATPSNADAFDRVGDAALAEGHYPLWNPYLFAGMPILRLPGLRQVSSTRPPPVFNFLQDQLRLPALDLDAGPPAVRRPGHGLAAVALEAAGWGSWCWARWSGCCFPRSWPGACTGTAPSWGRPCTCPGSWAGPCGSWTAAARRAVGMTGLLLGLQFLRGHVQITYYTLLVVGWLGAVEHHLALRCRPCAR